MKCTLNTFKGEIVNFQIFLSEKGHLALYAMTQGGQVTHSNLLIFTAPKRLFLPPLINIPNFNIFTLNGRNEHKSKYLNYQFHDDSAMTTKKHSYILHQFFINNDQ